MPSLRHRASLDSMSKNIGGIPFRARIQMDANVSAKRQRTWEFDVSGVPLIDVGPLRR
jgi:hypothetical protein